MVFCCVLPVAFRLFFSLNSDDHTHRPYHVANDKNVGDDADSGASLGGNATPSLRRRDHVASQANSPQGRDAHAAMSFHALLGASMFCFVFFLLHCIFSLSCLLYICELSVDRVEDRLTLCGLLVDGAADRLTLCELSVE